jgi:hypothetical protein
MGRDVRKNPLPRGTRSSRPVRFRGHCGPAVTRYQSQSNKVLLRMHAPTAICCGRSCRLVPATLQLARAVWWPLSAVPVSRGPPRPWFARRPLSNGGSRKKSTTWACGQGVAA